jgi:hypothetical protein
MSRNAGGWNSFFGKLLPFVCALFLGSCAGPYGVTEPSIVSSSESKKIRNKSDLLETYRLPSPIDLKADWKDLHESGRRIPWRTQADFNGDQRTDYAYLLSRRDREAFALIVLMADETGFEEYKLEELREPVYCCGIYRKSPGTYRRINPRTDDRPNQRPTAEVKLTRPAVEFVYFEASSRIYYWDEDQETFLRVWTGD